MARQPKLPPQANATYEATIISPDDPDRSWLNWPGRASAPSILGVTRPRLAELVKTGRLEEYLAPDGSRRYKPIDLATLADEILFEPTTVEEENDAERTRVGGLMVDSMKASTDLLTQSQKHVERLVDVVVSNQEKATKAWSGTLEFLTRQCEMLQRTHVEALAAKEQSAREQIEATVEAEVTLAAETRRTAITEAVVPHIGPLVASLGLGLQEAAERLRGTVAKSSTAAAETQPPAEMPVQREPTVPDAPMVGVEGKATALLRSVGREKLDMLVVAGLLDETQLALLEEVRKEIGQ